MGQWTKHYFDGSTYTGSDEAIIKGEASWTRSRNSHIIAVDLSHKNFFLSIYGPGEYWQSDTYESRLMENGAKLVKRRIERKIEPNDMYFGYATPELGKAFIRFDNKDPRGTIIKIPSSKIGKWLILELDIETGEISQYIRDNKL